MKIRPRDSPISSVMTWSTMSRARGVRMATQYDAVIVGAGFGGMGAAIQLRRLGLDNLLIPAPVRSAFARLPLTQRAVRLVGTSILEATMVSGVLHYKQVSAVNKVAEKFCRAHLFRQVRDPGLRRRLTPDYSFGCKRPTFSNDYFPTFTQPHVHLETTSIERIDETGIVTTDGNRTEIDVLLLATIPGVRGRDHARLPEPGVAEQPLLLRGLSYFTTIECQMKHMDRLFTTMRKRGATVFEVTQGANDEFLERMTAKVGNSVFALGQCATANSYYFNQHGEATLLRPSSTLSAYREATSFRLDDYSYA
jgi:hypothetical protein